MPSYAQPIIGEWYCEVASSPLTICKSDCPYRVSPVTVLIPTANVCPLNFLGAYRCEYWSPKSTFLGIVMKPSSAVNLSLFFSTKFNVHSLIFALNSAPVPGDTIEIFVVFWT